MDCFSNNAATERHVVYMYVVRYTEQMSKQKKKRAVLLYSIYVVLSEYLYMVCASTQTPGFAPLLRVAFLSFLFFVLFSRSIGPATVGLAGQVATALLTRSRPQLSSAADADAECSTVNWTKLLHIRDVNGKGNFGLNAIAAPRRPQLSLAAEELKA